ncbi:potassium channel family protein, partial [Pradoshia sp.]
LGTIHYLFNKLHIVMRLIIVVFLLIIVFGCLIHLLEPATFHSIGEGMWWAIQTMATVGYGDIVPTSLLGRIIAFFAILLGGGFVAYYFTAMSSYMIQTQTALTLGTMAYKGDGHIILVGYNERTKKIIEAYSQLPIVIVDGTLKEHPIPHSDAFFICGDSTKEDSWIKANVTKSKLVVITADPSKTEKDSDMNVITSLLAVKGVHPTAYCISEILTPAQIQNALRAGATAIIETNDLVSQAFINIITDRI